MVTDIEKADEAVRRAGFCQRTVRAGRRRWARGAAARTDQEFSGGCTAALGRFL